VQKLRPFGANFCRACPRRFHGFVLRLAIFGGGHVAERENGMAPIVGDGRTVAELDRRVASLVDEFTDSPIGKLVTALESPIELVTATVREIYWEIHCYQPSTTRAGFTMISGLPPEERKIMRILLLHKWEEVEHRVWALNGYLALGGDRSRIGRENEFMSTGAFAVAAVWDLLAQKLEPLSYLGAEYLFEDLTARLSKMVTQSLSGRGLPQQGMRFIVDHATEDERHSRLLKKLINEVEGQRPESVSQMLFAFDCFRHVYPLPLWMGSYARALASVGSSSALNRASAWLSSTSTTLLT
jgi:hypothetical protein